MSTHNSRRLIANQPQWSWGIVSVLVLAIVAVGVKIIFFSHAGSTSTWISAEAESGNRTTGATLASDANASGGQYVLFGATPTPPPTPTPVPCGTAGGTCTPAQVATHNTSSNCWVTLEGNYYNLTSFISQHAGGSSYITAVCGQDATTVFQGQASESNGASHSHSNNDLNSISQYEIGPTS